MGSTVPIWLAVVTAIAAVAGPAATFGAAWIALYYTNKRQQAEFEERKREDLRAQRREAYRTLARVTKTVDPTQPYELRDLAEAYSEVELLTESPEVLETAANLYRAAFEARKLARAKYTAGHQRPERDHYVAQSFRRSQEKRDAFLDAARVELGLPPSPTPLQLARVSVRELLVQPSEDDAQEPSEPPGARKMATEEPERAEPEPQSGTSRRSWLWWWAAWILSLLLLAPAMWVLVNLF